MKINLNQITIPFQIDQDVFIHQPLHFWSDGRQKTVPYFSGVIKLIEICVDPKSRFAMQKRESIDLVIDRIRYEIIPHSHFNPFGRVQIFDRVERGSALYPTEADLLQATGSAPSVYYPLVTTLTLV